MSLTLKVKPSQTSVTSSGKGTGIGRLILLLFLVFAGRAFADSPAGLNWRQVTPSLSDEVLFNPGMGLYMAGGSGLGYKPEPDAWLLSACDIVYFRPTWNDLEEDGPAAGFDEYFEPVFDFRVRQRGKRVAFRVMSESTHYRGKPEQLEQTGFTRDKYVAAYRRVIDAQAQAFPNTRVFLNVGSYPEINDYAALRGCHFRQDGLTPGGPSANVRKLYYHPYSRRGVICNYEFHSYQQQFESAGHGWNCARGIQSELDSTVFHDGKSSLHLSGRQTSGWNYVAHTLPHNNPETCQRLEENVYEKS